MGISIRELIVILVIVLLLFGAKKIPELARGLGKGLREFKNAVKDSGIDEVKPDTESAAGAKSEAAAKE